MNEFKQGSIKKFSTHTKILFGYVEIKNCCFPVGLEPETEGFRVRRVIIEPRGPAY